MRLAIMLELALPHSNGVSLLDQGRLPLSSATDEDNLSHTRRISLNPEDSNPYCEHSQKTRCRHIGLNDVQPKKHVEMPTELPIGTDSWNDADACTRHLVIP